MKKIDVIFPVYLNFSIGPTGTIRRLIKNKDYLKTRGYDLEVFTSDFMITDKNDEAINFSSGKRSKIRSWLRKSRFFSMMLAIRSMYHARRLVKRYAALNRNPDMVVFHEIDGCYSYMKNVSSIAKRICFFHTDGKRWIMFFKLYPKLEGSLFMKYLNKILDYVINNLDKYVFITKIGFENFLMENPSVEKTKVAFFHNGIDDRSIIPFTDNSIFSYRLCCTGTICERKGQYLIIEALNLLDTTIKNTIHLTLIGSGPDLEILKKKVKQYKLEKNVTFEGNVFNDLVHEKLCKENIYILMSNNEGLPISIIEGMRAGLPIISTNISGIPELVISQYNGILVDPTVESLLAVLKHISEYDWKTMGINSRERFEKEFSFEQMKKSYCDMLDSLF
jgi:glycosyltransferase involved in cell wall biosynthesis